MTATAYQAFDGSTLDSLNTKIATAIAGGFQPFGAPSYSPESRRYVQACIKGSIDGGGSLPAGSVAVANGDTVAVRNSAGADSHNGTAVVTGSTLTGLNLASSVALVDNGDAITVNFGTGADVTGGTVAVLNGVVVRANLPGTSAAVANGQQLTVPVTGTYASKATVSVSNGVVTGIALS